MGRLVLIDVAGAVTVLGLWYLGFAIYNRRKGSAALRWVQAACAGKGNVLDSHWLGVSSHQLHARLQFPSRGFQDARVTIRFHPRSSPVHWIVSCWHKQKETLTFEADLGGSPSFHLEVVRHRWSARSRGARQRDEREWDLYHPGPLILTTRTHWKEDPSSELNALMTVRQQDVLQVRFRPESPQFSVTVNLDALSDPANAAGFLSTLRELAAGASAHRQ